MHPFSNPWKHQKALWFSDVFRGKRKGAMETNGLNKMVLIKSFLTRAFHGYGKFICVYLSERDKAREYYSN